MMRWALWFLLVPQLFLLAGWLGEARIVAIDAGALVCLFLAWFARPSALPGLLLGAAVGRAVVDEAGVAVQILVLGVPVAVLLPLRALLYRHQLGWQIAATAVFAVAVPRCAGLCGAWFDQPSAAAVLDGQRVLWTSLLAPLMLAVLRRLPPMARFVERTA